MARPAENTARFDPDAAGHGWFIDPTPLADEEFQAGGSAVPGGPADGRVDLLSAMLHELEALQLQNVEFRYVTLFLQFPWGQDAKLPFLRS